MDTQPAWFLVVDDDALVARGVRRILERYAPTHTAGSCTDALGVLGDGICGLVVDMGLPDGDGLDVLRPVLKARPGLPALLLTGSEDAKYIHEAYALGARYLRKDASFDEIDSFGRHAVARVAGVRERILDAISRYAVLHKLTKREVEIVTAAMEGANHARLASLGNVSTATIKTQVHTLLRKTGAATLQQLVAEILLLTLRA